MSGFKSRQAFCRFFCGVILIAISGFSGCSKTDAGGAVGSRPGETSEIVEARKAFDAAHVSLRFALDEVLRVVSTPRPADALAPLQKLAANPALNERQKQALNALMQKIKSDPNSLSPH